MRSPASTETYNKEDAYSIIKINKKRVVLSALFSYI